MKKRFFAGLMCLLSTSASACVLPVYDAPNVRQVVRQDGGYPISEQNCQLLVKNGMYLHVNAVAAVLSGVNVGTATVAVWKDGVISDEAHRSLRVNTATGSQDLADAQMLIALKEAIDWLDFNNAIKEVKEKTAKLAKKR